MHPPGYGLATEEGLQQSGQGERLGSVTQPAHSQVSWRARPSVV
jgi:hypothetical protein